jgi:uracil permease
LFNTKNLAIVSVILTVGLGGTFAFPGGLIPIFGANLPAIATAAVFGIVLNLIINFKSFTEKS